MPRGCLQVKREAGRELRPPEPRSGASLKDKYHPEAEVTSAGPGQGIGDPGWVCEGQEGLRGARTSPRPSNRSRQVWVRWPTKTKARTASNKRLDRLVTDSPGTGKGVQGSKAGVAKAEGADWTKKPLKLSANGEQGRGLKTDIRESGGQDRGDQPGVRGGLREPTEVSLVVEAGSGSSPEGNSDLEVGSGMNWVSGVMQPGGVQSAEGHQLPLCFSRDLWVELWSKMRGSPMGANGQGHG
ncbi:hypothetical protein F5J12DRAFT_785809 [Pisolithus orientalis]|uniref:uncharacterized protein n=1 Tax=Pisolithus orientalis TaxID=936130 RepID=UPI00222478B5|nr:uncharacterized protein F5J12DRAFT_785809 [Pisolithus orientalis]KAI5994245.1 hypothetical protein F5J12DRAFT_785809 [Pisolithus orientalis]